MKTSRYLQLSKKERSGAMTAAEQGELQELSDGFRQLFEKENCGTLTAAENQELRELSDALASNHFYTCRLCGGAFTTVDHRRTGGRCPNCDIQIHVFSSDITGHFDDEIDDSLDPQQLMGEFCVWYLAAGTVPCFKCGTVYPKNYTCCPRLLQVAIDATNSGRETTRDAAIRFIDAHSEVLLNSLRGRFRSLYSKEDLENLRKVSGMLNCGMELLEAVEETG